MPIDRRKFLAVAGATASAIAGGYALMNPGNERVPAPTVHSPGSVGSGSETSTPDDGDVLSIEFGTEYVLDSAERSYRAIHWGDGGTLVLEPEASLTLVDTLES